jgi:phosphonate transport system ATP-binding protein
MNQLAVQTNPAALTVTGLNVYRGDYHALRDVQFAIEPGEFVAILGRSGAGKTTLLHALSGLVPVHGAVTWHTQRRAVVFQHYRLVPQLSAITNVASGRLGRYAWWESLGGFRASDREAAKAWLEQFGLNGRSVLPARQLSGGEQQRVALARALIQEPEFLLADEPVASLDAETSNEIMERLADLNRQHGLTVLCVLHDLEMAERYARRVLLLEQGRVVHDGPAEQLPQLVREKLQWKTLL